MTSPSLRNQMLSATAHRALHNAMESNRRARPPAPKHTYVFSKEDAQRAVDQVKANAFSDPLLDEYLAIGKGDRR